MVLQPCATKGKVFEAREVVGGPGPHEIVTWIKDVGNEQDTMLGRR